MKKHGIATLVLATAIFWVTNASAIGVGVGFILPTGDMGDAWDAGFGAHAIMDYPITPLASIYGDVGYQTFMGKTIDLGAFGEAEMPDINMWNISAGAKAGFGAIYVGGEIGYYIVSDDIDNEIGIVPLIGTAIGPLDLSGRYKLTDDFNWFEVRGSLSF